MTAFATDIGRLISYSLMYTDTTVKHTSDQQKLCVVPPLYISQKWGRMLEMDIHKLSAKNFNIRLTPT